MSSEDALENIVGRLTHISDREVTFVVQGGTVGARPVTFRLRAMKNAVNKALRLFNEDQLKMVFMIDRDSVVRKVQSVSEHEARKDG